MEQFHLTLWFPSKIIIDQGRNFESELIENLCQVAGVKKLRISPYHTQTNGQCVNSTLLNMQGTLTSEQNKKAVGLMAQLKEEPSNVETKSSKTIHGHQLCMMYTCVL